MAAAGDDNRAVRVHMVQPIVPHYRVPFYEGVARRTDLSFSLSVSNSVPNMPRTKDVRGLAVDTEHEFVGLFGGALLWQRGMALPPDLGPGAALVVDGNPRWLSNYPLILAARRRGIAVVWWGHLHSVTSNTLRTRIRRSLMGFADMLLVYTDAEKDDLLLAGCDPARVSALNNALDDAAIAERSERWQGRPLREFMDRQRLATRKVLLFCGRLRVTPSTELEVALRAMPDLIRRDPSYLLVVVGEGPDATRLKTLALQLGIADHVRWLGALYDDEQLAPWFLASRCFVYPGPIGLSLIQALGYGLPVITHANRSQHNPEIAALSDGINGLMFPRGDAAALADCVHRACAAEEFRTALAIAARETIRTNYSMANMIERFAHAVKTAARGSSRAPRIDAGMHSSAPRA